MADIDLSVSKVRQIHQVLAQVLDMAVDDGCLAVNPARGVRVPRFVCNMIEPLIEGRRPDEWVWQRRSGGPMALPTPGSWFQGALGRARAADPDFPEVTLTGCGTSRRGCWCRQERV